MGVEDVKLGSLAIDYVMYFLDNHRELKEIDFYDEI